MERLPTGNLVLLNAEPARNDAKRTLLVAFVDRFHSPKSVMDKDAASSSRTALRNRIFRAIWFASLISGICTSAHGTGATWAMNQLSHSALFVSIISTCTSLPFFLFTLPAGAIADIMDRGC